MKTIKINENSFGEILEMRIDKIDIGFNDSYCSEGFAQSIDPLNTLLKKYGLKLKTTFIDASTEPEYRWSVKIEKED